MSPRAISLVGWGIAFGLLLAWEGVVLTRRHDGWVTFSELIATVRWPVTRWVLFALWLWFGWHVSSGRGSCCPGSDHGPAA